VREYYLLTNFLSKQDTVEVEGEVEKNLPNTQFQVLLDSGQEIIAHLSGRMRVHRIRILPGDRVKVALSPYDLTKGRIVQRIE
jgi:translation initiation factor IF-1